ncbi:MAG: sulfatase-like hydrolase/transferase, partial [Candidatus Sulfotelmatobacter sp.]
YQVLRGTVPFYGATVPGEARELCDSKIGFYLLKATVKELQGCLPERLAALGYRDVALHGMDGHMFNRSTWYRSIGFQEQWFRDRFRREGLPDCVGAFTGTCDAAIAQWIGRRLDRQDASPDFLYWVTLNSHLPVPIPAPIVDGYSCSMPPLLSQQPAFCSWYQLVANVHHSVAQVAMTELARPTVFIIVGDHAPPFSNPLLRGQFSSEMVPYIVLVPRLEQQSAKLRASGN